MARLKRVRAADSSPSHAALVGDDRRRSSLRRESTNLRVGIGSALYAASAAVQATHDRIKRTQNVSRRRLLRGARG